MDTLGIHFDGAWLRCAKLRRRQLIFCQTLAQAADVKRLYSAGVQCASSIPTSVRTVRLPTSSRKQIEQGLRFQIEALSHVPLEELIYVSRIGSQEASVFLARKALLQDHLGRWRALEMDPSCVSAHSQALALFARWRCPALTTGFIVHLGMDSWTCVLVENGLVKRAFSLEEGTAALLGALHADAPQSAAHALHLLQLNTSKYPTLSNRLQEMRKQLQETFAALQSTVQSVLFTGTVDAFGFFRAYLLDGAPHLSLYEPTPSLKTDERQSAIAIGAALESLSHDRLQFLKGEFVPASVWKQAGKRAALLLGASFTLSIAGLGIGIWQLSQNERTFKSSKTASAVQIIEEYKQESPYLSTVPTASEVLSWISKHPLLDALRIAGDPLEIVAFHYELISLPKIGDMDAAYTGKVTLEFQVKWPTSARKFHDALLAEVRVVDPSLEIAWESFADGYKASFYLKKRPPHVF